MMDFDLTEDQQLIERTVRQWAAREVAPHIRELDREHRFDPRILPQMAELGLLGAGGIWRRRDGLHQPRPDQRRARVRGYLAARDHVGPRRLELPDAAVV